MRPDKIIKYYNIDLEKLYMQNEFNRSEAAVILNMHNEDVSRLLSNKKIKGIKKNGSSKWTITKKHIEDYIIENDLKINFGYRINIKNLKTSVDNIYDWANKENNERLIEIAEKIKELTAEATNIVNES